MVEKGTTSTRILHDSRGKLISVFDEPSEDFIGYVSSASAIDLAQHDSANYVVIAANPDDLPFVGVAEEAPLGSHNLQSSSTTLPNYWERSLNAQTTVQMGVVNQLNFACRSAMILQGMNRFERAFCLPAAQVPQLDDSFIDTLSSLHDTISGKWAKLTMEAVASPDFVAGDRARERLVIKLWSSFANEPVEDGMEHPAEKIMDEAMQFSPNRLMLAWLKQICTDVSCPSFAASVMKCLARQHAPGSAIGVLTWSNRGWRQTISRSGTRLCKPQRSGLTTVCWKSSGRTKKKKHGFKTTFQTSSKTCLNSPCSCFATSRARNGPTREGYRKVRFPTTR